MTSELVDVIPDNTLIQELNLKEIGIFISNITVIIISNTMTGGKLVIKCPQKMREDLWNYKSCRDLRGHLITNFPICHGISL